MHNEGNEPHFETDEARGGSTPHIVRWILAISLFGAIALLSIIWITGAATQRGAEEEASVAAQVREQRDAAEAEGMLSDRFDELDAPEPGDADRDTARTIPN
jgi:type VI protein secretion system component VasK